MCPNGSHESNSLEEGEKWSNNVSVGQRTSFQSWRRDHGGWKRKGRRASGPDRKTDLAVIFRDRDLRFPAWTWIKIEGKFSRVSTAVVYITPFIESPPCLHTPRQNNEHLHRRPCLLLLLRPRRPGAERPRCPPGEPLDATARPSLTLISGTARRESLRRLVLCILLAHTTASTPAVHNARRTQPNDDQLYLGRHRRRLSVEVLQHLKPRA